MGIHDIPTLVIGECLVKEENYPTLVHGDRVQGDWAQNCDPGASWSQTLFHTLNLDIQSFRIGLYRYLARLLANNVILPSILPKSRMISVPDMDIQ